MTTSFDQARVELDQSLFLRIVDAAGTAVTCLDGCLWVTRDGSLKDIVLASGESYLVADATRVIVTAFGPSLARVSQAAAQPQPAERRPPRSFLRHLGTA